MECLEYVDKKGKLVRATGNNMDMLVIELEKEVQYLTGLVRVGRIFEKSVDEDIDNVESDSKVHFEIKIRLEVFSLMLSMIKKAMANDNASELKIISMQDDTGD